MTMAEALAEFNQEMGSTRTALERIPDAHLAFRPHEKSWTLAELASHIANIPLWLQMTLATSELDLAAPMEQPRPPGSTRELLGRFDTNVAGAQKALEQAPEGALGEPWTLRRGPQVVFTLPRGSVIRTMILSHLIHHRGQLTVYLRMVGAKVPGLYGPSGDEA